MLGKTGISSRFFFTNILPSFSLKDNTPILWSLHIMYYDWAKPVVPEIITRRPERPRSLLGYWLYRNTVTAGAQDKKYIKAKGEMTMFNFGNGCGDACGGSELWSCLLNLIILFIVLEFLCNIISGNNGLSCGAGC